MPENKKAVGCFIEFDNKILILHRVENCYQGGQWGLVGGKMEKDETTEQTIIREIKEEIGFDASNENLELLGKYVTSYPDQDWDFFVYRIKLNNIIDIELDPSEHTEYAWRSPEECFKMENLMEGARVLLEKLEYIKK